MSRGLQLFKSFPDQLKKLGKYTTSTSAMVVWVGTIGSGPYAGFPAAVLDASAATWADNNKRVVLVGVPANNLMPDTMKTQSHAAGQFIQDSFSFRAYFETPEDWTGAQAAWTRIVTHVIVGQNAAPLEIFFGDNDVQPIVEGVNGGTSGQQVTSNFVSAGVYLPYALSYSGGI